MSIINKGDIYGRSSFSTPSIRNHIRSAHYDYGSISLDNDGLLGDVRPKMGKSGSSSNLCIVQLSCSENQFKESN
jgi:hypothetical protein